MAFSGFNNKKSVQTQQWSASTLPYALDKNDEQFDDAADSPICSGEILAKMI